MGAALIGPSLKSHKISYGTVVGELVGRGVLERGGDGQKLQRRIFERAFLFEEFDRIWFGGAECES